MGSFEEAQALREEWDRLADRVGGDVFNTFDWAATWWKHFGRGRKLAIYMAYGGEELLAAWPLFRDTIRWGPVWLRVVRIVGCDHGVTTCNVLTLPAALDEVAPAILDAIEADGSWDLLHFGELPGYASNVALLGDALRRSSHAGEVRVEDDVYPQALFDVPDDYETYLASLSLKERRNVRRDDRDLQKAGADAVELRTTQELDRAFDVLINLHRSHWRARGRQGHFDDFAGVESFHREMARKCLENRRLAMVEVKNADGVLSSEYALRFRDRVHWIIGGRRENVTSRVGFGAVMRAAIRDGAVLIDGLPGTYDYKRRLGARSLSVKMIEVVPRGGRGATRLALMRAIVRAVSFAYHRAWFWHLAPWFMKRMPQLSSLLVRPGLWERFARSRFLVIAKHAVKEKPVEESTDSR